MSSRCPKCNEKIKATYLKPNCPKCGVNMLYYKLDEQLEADAKKASDEVETVNRFVNMLKNSTMKTPWHIIRLILFFTPLLSMCLPMFWAGHKNVSIITFIMSIINHGFDLGAVIEDKSYLFAVLSIIFVILLSIAEILCSLFTATEKGNTRNVVVYIINLSVLLIFSVLVVCFGGKIKIGLFVTLIIYILKFVLHNVIAKTDKNKIIVSTFIIILAFIALTPFSYTDEKITICPAIEECDVSVVSFNVASAYGTKFEDTDSMDRCERFAEYMNAYHPTFIGTQEMNSYWLERLDKALVGYNSYAVKRGGDSDEKSSEMNAVFYDENYKLIEENTIWLSETPNVESKYIYVDENGKTQEAGCNRICTYVVLYGNYSTYIFLNTHLDNIGEEARLFGANVILNKIARLQEVYNNSKIILTGDLNETSDNDAYKLIASKLNDATDKTKEQATYQEWGYRNNGDKPIDFIFTNGKAENYLVLQRLDNGYVSDHYGIYSELTFD